MTQFWEFFTFELKFRAKSISTYVYFLLWFMFEFFCIASESFGPIGNANGKDPSQRPIRQHLQLHRRQLLRRHRHRRHLRHLDPPRLPARHHPDSLHQAHQQVRLSRRPLGRFLRHHRLRLLRNALRRLPWHLRPLGRPRRIAPESSPLVPPAVLLHLRRPDLLPRLPLLPRRRALAQDLHRLPPGRGHLHGLPTSA